MIQHGLHCRYRHAQNAVGALHCTVTVTYFRNDHMFASQNIHTDSCSHDIGDGLISSHLMKMKMLQGIPMDRRLRCCDDCVDLLRRLLHPAADRKTPDESHHSLIASVMLDIMGMGMRMFMLMVMVVVFMRSVAVDMLMVMTCIPALLINHLADPFNVCPYGSRILRQTNQCVQYHIAADTGSTV